MSKIFSYLALVFGFLGFLDATYLTIVHYKNIAPPCSIAHGCETVLTSQYASVFGIPIALIGAGFYLTVLVLLGLYMQNKTSQRVLSLLMVISIGSLIISAILVYLQAEVLHAFCQYCLTSEGINVLLFICFFLLWRQNPSAKTAS